MSRITLVQGSRAVAVVSAVLVVAVAVGLVTVRGSRADASVDAAPPTATVTSRSMAVTSQVDGTVQRAARYEVAFGASQVALAPDASAGGPASGSIGSTGAAATAWSDAGAATVALVMDIGAAAATRRRTRRPADRRLTRRSTRLRTRPRSRLRTRHADPTPTAKPRTAPSDDAPPASSAVPDASRTGGGAIAVPGSAGSTSGAPAVTLTSIAALGTVVETGTVLYSADGEPVVAVRTAIRCGALA